MERFELESKCSATLVLSEVRFLFFCCIAIKEIQYGFSVKVTSLCENIKCGNSSDKWNKSAF